MKYLKFKSAALSLFITLFVGSALNAQSISVSPMGGEQVLANKAYNINWDTKAISGTVRVELLNVSNGQKSLIMENYNGNNLSYVFPANLEGSDLRIAITSATDPQKQIFSDSYFNIVTKESNPKPVVLSTESTIDSDFNIYPNPSTDGTFSIAWSKNNIEKVQILDASGKIVMERELSNVQSISGVLHESPSGVYFAKLIFKDGKSDIRKFEVVR